MTKKKENARMGRPPIRPELKKRRIGVALPIWLIAKLLELKESRKEPREVSIEIALCEKHGWKAP